MPSLYLNAFSLPRCLLVTLMPSLYLNAFSLPRCLLVTLTPSLYLNAFHLPGCLLVSCFVSFWLHTTGFYSDSAVKNLVTWFNSPIRSQVFRVVLTVKIKQFIISIVIIQQQQLSIIYQYLSS